MTTPPPSEHRDARVGEHSPSCCGHDHHHSGNAAAGHEGHTTMAPTDSRAIDPVCGMRVDPQKTQHRHSFEGRTYYFCSAGCKTKFATGPAKYLAAKDAEPAATPAQARATDPVCGMQVDPQTTPHRHPYEGRTYYFC